MFAATDRLKQAMKTANNRFFAMACLTAGHRIVRVCMRAIARHIAIVLVVLVSRVAPGAEPLKLDEFAYRNAAEAQRAWQGTYAPEIESRLFGSGVTGLVLPCQFPRSGDRCFWDRTLERPLDLSAYENVQVAIHVDNATNVKERCISFAVADRDDPAKIVGWYAYWLPDPAGGLHPYLMPKSEFRTEGDIPDDGWKRIAKIRISVWGGISQSSARVTIGELQATVVPTKTYVSLVAAPRPEKVLERIAVLPEPQQWHRTSESFKCPTLQLPVTYKDDEETRRVLALIGRDWRADRGIELMVQPGIEGDSVGKSVFLGDPGTFSQRQFDQLAAGGALRAEGYRLEVQGDGILLIAADEAGLFYGFQTLGQLLTVADSAISAAGVQITDYPELSMRAMYMHWLGQEGETGYDKAKAFIKALAALKINTLFIDVGPSMKYDSRAFPVTGSKAFSKERLRELAQFAKEYHVELCPFYQLFGHTPWIGNEPAYAHLMENPKQVNWYSSWCASNPETFEFARDILGEAVEVFHPRYVHIAHDEIDFTDVATCPRCQGRNREDLIAASMNTLDEYLQGLGARTIVSGDTFIPWFPRQTADRQLDGERIIRQIRKSIIINGWSYGPEDSLQDEMLSVYERHGFTGESLTFSPWYDAEGIRVTAMNMMERQGLGGIGTLWHAWGGFYNYPDQIADFCLGTIGLSAYCFWNPDATPVGYSDLDWNYRIRRMVEPRWSIPDGGRKRTYESIPLADAAVPVPGRPGFADGPVFPASIELEGLSFVLPSRSSAVVLRGHRLEIDLPEKQTIQIDRRANELYFLHAVSEPYDIKLWQTPDRMQLSPGVGKYCIIYADGTSCDVPLRFRLNITSWNSPVGVNEGRVAWQGEDASGRLVRLGCTAWRNPSPEKVISHIEFSTASESGMNPMLFAIIAGVAEQVKP